MIKSGKVDTKVAVKFAGRNEGTQLTHTNTGAAPGPCRCCCGAGLLPAAVMPPGPWRSVRIREQLHRSSSACVLIGAGAPQQQQQQSQPARRADDASTRLPSRRRHPVQLRPGWRVAHGAQGRGHARRVHARAAIPRGVRASPGPMPAALALALAPGGLCSRAAGQGTRGACTWGRRQMRSRRQVPACPGGRGC